MLQCDKCLNVNSEHMKASWIPSAAHVPCIHESQIKVFRITVFVTLLFSNSIVDFQIYSSGFIMSITFQWGRPATFFAITARVFKISTWEYKSTIAERYVCKWEEHKQQWMLPSVTNASPRELYCCKTHYAAHTLVSRTVSVGTILSLYLAEPTLLPHLT